MAFCWGVSYLSKELTIIINEDNPQTTATFTVPERLLTEHSTFFQSACRDASGEAATVIKLPQVDPDAFRAYHSWIHGGTLTFTTNSDSQGASASNLYPISLALVKLWLLADRLTTTKLRNDTTQALSRVLPTVDHTQGSSIEGFPPSITVLIWSATTEDHSLRNIVVEYYASKVPLAQIDEHFQELHPEFVQELTQKIVEMHKDPDSNLPTAQVNGDSTSQVNSVNHEGSAPPNSAQPVDAVAQPDNPPATRRPATHQPARIILKDKLGNILRASCALFDILNHTISAIHPLLHDRTGDVGQNQVEVTLQFPDNTSQPLDREEWTKTYGQITRQAGRHFTTGRGGAFVIEFGDGSFPEDMGYAGILNHRLLLPLRP